MSEPRPQGDTHPFSADRPILSRSEDRLGRAPFAAAVAEAISGWKGDDSLVVAIYGAWGNGKTSVKNMLLEVLQDPSKRSTIDVREFNPWQVTDQATLSQAFFKDVGVALGETDPSERGRRAANRWRRYAAALALGHSITDILRRSYVLVFSILAGLGLGVVILPSWPIRLVAAIFYLVVLGWAALFKASSEVAERTAAWFEAREKAAQKTLLELKASLADLLKARSKPLVIVMDDVDRLDAGEIRLLMRLIKAHADLPRLVYVILCQRDVVERALDDPHGSGTGREFLEKIVQVGFDLPAPDRTRMMRILTGGLDDIIEKDPAIERRFDQKRWQELFADGLEPYFGSARAIVRFLSSLRFHVGLFRNGGSFEVNMTDLIALEVLRVFEPSIYSRVSRSKRILTTPHKEESIFYIEPDVAKAIVTSIVNEAPESRRRQVETILKHLFPHTEWIFKGSHYSDHDDRWYRELRVCSEDVFDRFFQLATPQGDISQAQLEEIISLSVNREALANRFRELDAEGLFAVALDRLDSYKEDLDIAYAESFVTALFDVGDILPDRRPGFFEMSPDTHAVRIVLWYLRKEPSVERRAAILKSAIRQAIGLNLPVRQVHLESELHREGKTNSQLIDPEILEEVKTTCVAKIHAWAEDGRLASSPHRQFILYRWLQWGAVGDVREWVARLTADNDSLLAFLKEFPMPSPDPFEHVAYDQWKLSLDALEAVMPLDDLQRRLAILVKERTREDEVEVVRNYLAGLRWRTSKSQEPPQE